MYIYYFCIGACIGSFLNVLIYRLPLEEEKDVIKKRSHCPGCKTLVPFYFNIPVLAYVFLRGKCRYCAFKIPKKYFFNELLMGVCGVYLLFRPDSLLPFTENILLFSLLGAFIVHFWIDLKYQILPDSVNVYIACVCLFLSVFTYDLPWTHYFLGAALGFGGTFLITYLYYLWRKVQGFGGGDLKLFGALGILLGPQGIVLNIFYSCFLGALIGVIYLSTQKKSSNTPFAFGPAIILISIFQIFCPDQFRQLSRLLFSVYL